MNSAVIFATQIKHKHTVFSCCYDGMWLEHNNHPTPTKLNRKPTILRTGVRECLWLDVMRFTSTHSTRQIHVHRISPTTIVVFFPCCLVVVFSQPQIQWFLFVRPTVACLWSSLPAPSRLAPPCLALGQVCLCLISVGRVFSSRGSIRLQVNKQWGWQTRKLAN